LIRFIWLDKLKFCSPQRPEERPENDEILRILRIMQFLTLLIDRVPSRVVSERESLELMFGKLSQNLEKTGRSSESYHKMLDSRMTSLPSEMAKNISPEKIASEINRSLNQQFIISTIPFTVQTLDTAAKEIKQIQGSIQRRVIILDEAGMVSGRQMLELLQIAERNAARIVFSGDTKQIQSIEACDALRVLEKESRLKGIGLTQVKRQINDGYRQAIKELRRNPEAGFEKLDAIGAVREVAWQDRAPAVAQAFSEEQAKECNPLVVCATHDEIDRITETISNLRKQRGLIQLTGGRVLPSDCRQFDFGYAVTAHRSQGKSVDSVIISADGMQRELFYVAASCGRRNVSVINSSKEQLRESASISTARLSASELARKSHPGLYQGKWRGLDAARQMVKHMT
jgi:hypothetical protein